MTFCTRFVWFRIKRYKQYVHLKPVRKSAIINETSDQKINYNMKINENESNHVQ